MAAARDVVIHHKTDVNLSFPLAADAREVVLLVAAAAATVVDVVGPGPYSAGPLPGWRLRDCLHPALQKPWVSYKAVYLHLTKSVTYPAQSSSALIVNLLAWSSLPPASSCPLPPLPLTNCALILPLLAIAEAGEAVDPWIAPFGELDLMAEDLGLVETTSWLPEEADHGGVSTSAELSTWSLRAIVEGEGQHS